MMNDYKSHKEHFKGGYDAGGKMGYSHGGNVKDSPLVTRTKKTASNAADQEAGDQGKLRPGYKEGGKKKKGRTARASKFLAELVGKKQKARLKRKSPGVKEGGKMEYAGGGYMKGGKHDMDYGKGKK